MCFTLSKQNRKYCIFITGKKNFIPVVKQFIALKYIKYIRFKFKLWRVLFDKYPRCNYLKNTNYLIFLPYYLMFQNFMNANRKWIYVGTKCKLLFSPMIAIFLELFCKLIYFSRFSVPPSFSWLYLHYTLYFF